MENCKNEGLIDDMKKALFGNARKGLLEKVTSLQMQMKIVMAGIALIIGLIIKLMLK